MLVKVLGVLMLATLCYSYEGRDFEVPEEGFEEVDYNSTIAETARSNSFFCLERVEETVMVEGEYVRRVYYEGYQNTFENVWSVFVQFPLLAYLDVTRKRALIEVIINVYNSGTGTPPVELDIDDVCLGPFGLHEVTTFEEGVVIHIYKRDDPTFDADAVSTWFQDRVSAERNGVSTWVVSYPGQSSVTAFNLTSTMQSIPLHPGATSSDGADPTLLAVFLATYGGNYTIDGPTNDTISINLSDEEIEELNFAENPNPVNYGLEPGDIVFAVIGSILLIIVCGVTVFGYAIHPFL